MTADLLPPNDQDGGAWISSCGRYRYALWRSWQQTGDRWLVVIMLNPSTGDARQDDPTIRRVIAFAKAARYSRVSIGNLFAWRATNPDDLDFTDNPVGPANDDALLAMIGTADTVVAAWGADARAKRRVPALLALVADAGKTPMCWDVCQDGSPRHPLYLPSRATLRPWIPPEGTAP